MLDLLSKTPASPSSSTLDIPMLVPLIFTVSYVSGEKEYSFSEVVECLWEVQVRQHMCQDPVSSFKNSRLAALVF